jgi:hypothetical protein
MSPPAAAHQNVVQISHPLRDQASSLPGSKMRSEAVVMARHRATRFRQLLKNKKRAHSFVRMRAVVRRLKFFPKVESRVSCIIAAFIFMTCKRHRAVKPPKHDAT